MFMKLSKLLSVILALVFVLGAVAAVIPVRISAADDEEEFTPEVKQSIDADGKTKTPYLTRPFNTPEDKLMDMSRYKNENGYTIYVDEYTGEVAFRDNETGEAIFTNPYDIAVEGNANSTNVKKQLLSQLIITYEDNGDEKTFYSYEEAAEREQITIKNIKGGVRVEYAIGEIEVTRLVPRRISKDRFEEYILDHIDNEEDKATVKSFYTLYDTSDPSLTETKAKEIEAKFPITKRMAIYVFKDDYTKIELKRVEAIIKAYCSEFYTLDDMEQDHADTGFTGVDVAPACFRMALEYTIDDDGLSVRLPANGIRFDESTYKLLTVSVLPYMGAGNTQRDGYTFIPDGEGAVIDYSDISSGGSNISGQVYGADYAYITVTGGQYHHEQTMTYPVFGNVMTPGSSEEGETSSGQTGFAAIITEGDSMAEIVAKNESTHKYAYVYARFTPRPSDTYKLESSIENVSTAKYSITTKRKYSGSYVIKYILLSDKKKSEGANYECSYVGMAKAYRDYLESEGMITRKEASDVSEDIPLYIETFGSIKAASTFLSFPVSIDKPLTTFDDVAKIYDDLASKGVTNVKFKLTGYSNGGLDATYPSKVSWVSAIGGKSGFEDLKKYSEEKGFGIYPDFDFAYVSNTAMFDGFNQKKDAVRTIDSRYTSRKYYDSATQSLVSDSALAISPSRYGYFAEKFTKSYSEYGLNSLSVSTLGTTLNSDFDKKDPYNREDSKKFTKQLLSTLDEKYGDLMTDGGNAYVYPYVDNIIGAATDSSNYRIASRSVPFLGFVLHGYLNFAGGALNMEGDVEYSLLKALENGASIYFTLAYQNINELKESEKYNKYYSVDFSVWKDSIVENYNKINDALKGLQTVRLDSHGFITENCYRVPSDAELAKDEAANEKKQAELDKAAAEAAEQAELDRELAERKGVTYTPPKDSSGSSRITDYSATASDGTIFSRDPKYKVTGSSIVKETYEDGTVVYINYNSYKVIVLSGSEEIIIDALGFEIR